MLIKKRDDHGEELSDLRRLLDLHVTAKQRFLIEREIKCITSGARGEQNSAYYIDFKYRDSQNWSIIHDLRLSHLGFVAQIDHLLINRFLHIFVLESKNYYYGIKITPEGEFLAWNGRTYIGIESPIEQNKRHVSLLEKVVQLPDILPTRLGISISPTFYSYVMVAPNSRVDRPSPTKFDTSMVVKADTLVTEIEKRLDGTSPVGVFSSLAKLVSPETLRTFAASLAGLHRRSKINYAERFGVNIAEPPASKEQPVVPVTAPSTAGSTRKESTCDGCGIGLDDRVISFCRANKEKLGGKTLCRSCQRAVVPAPAAGWKSSGVGEGTSDTGSAVDKRGTCEKCGAAVDGKVVFYCRMNKEKFEGKILCRSCQKTP